MQVLGTTNRAKKNFDRCSLKHFKSGKKEAEISNWGKVISNWGNEISNWGRDFKLRQRDFKSGQRSQVGVREITNRGRDYKSVQNITDS